VNGPGMPDSSYALSTCIPTHHTKYIHLYKRRPFTINPVNINEAQPQQDMVNYMMSLCTKKITSKTGISTTAKPPISHENIYSLREGGCRTTPPKATQSEQNQTSQTIRDPPEGLGGVPVRTGDAGEDEDWDLFLITGVPALINSINRLCFFASIRKRWLPTSSLSGERLMHRMFGFCERVRSVSFQTAGS